ncbi:MAG: NAD(P)H-dependent glycerol-3-phosphate dehydrogenase, partial [Candidatus Binataceae bacterium]
MDNMRAAVLGAGAWGTALAVVLARSGRPATLAVRRGIQAAALRESRQNSVYLPGIELPENLTISDRWRETAAESGLIIMAIPSSFARNAMRAVAQAIRPGSIIVSATKGIEADSFKTMTAMLAETVPAGIHLAALSGPGFAAEIAGGKPAALVAAASEDNIARAVQQIFAVRYFRVYRSSDVIGVELAGAAKNVIAIAAGISDGLMLGSSARAALVTRGLAELSRLVMALGG